MRLGRLRLVNAALLVALWLAPLAADDAPALDAIPAAYAPMLAEYQNLIDLGLYPQALAQIVSLRRQIEQELDPVSPPVIRVNLLVSKTYGQLKRQRDAENVLAALSARLDKAGLARSDRQISVWEFQRDLYTEWGDAAKARTVADRIKALREALAVERFRPRLDLVKQQDAASQRDLAIEQARTNVRDAETLFGSSHPLAAETRSMLADLLAKKKAEEDRAREIERQRVEAERLEAERVRAEEERLQREREKTRQDGEATDQGKVQP